MPLEPTITSLEPCRHVVLPAVLPPVETPARDPLGLGRLELDVQITVPVCPVLER